MSTENLFVDRVIQELAAFGRLWRNRPALAVLLLVALLAGGGYWLYDRSHQLADLTRENHDLKADNRQLRTENQGLKETVSPLLKQAAERFPNEEIVSALKKVVENLALADPGSKPIRTVTASVRIQGTQDKNNQGSTQYLSSSVYLALAVGTQPLLLAHAHEMFGRPLEAGQALFTANLVGDDDHTAIGKPVRALKQAEYLEIGMSQLPEGPVFGGSAVVTINSEIRLEFAIPPQGTSEHRVFLRDLRSVLSVIPEQVAPTNAEASGK